MSECPVPAAQLELNNFIFSLAYTDFIDSEGGIDGASGPVELPPNADRPDAEIQYDDNDVQAVQLESDNYLIDQSEAACRKVGDKSVDKHKIDSKNVQDREDYCDEYRVSDYLGAEHTMCKYCVSPYFLLQERSLHRFMFQGVGSACPYHIDSANNDLTGRGIESNEVKELIVQLHNEVRLLLPQSRCMFQYSQSIFPGRRA